MAQCFSATALLCLREVPFLAPTCNMCLSCLSALLLFYFHDESVGGVNCSLLCDLSVCTLVNRARLAEQPSLLLAVSVLQPVFACLVVFINMNSSQIKTNCCL